MADQIEEPVNVHVLPIRVAERQARLIPRPAKLLGLTNSLFKQPASGAQAPPLESDCLARTRAVGGTQSVTRNRCRSRELGDGGRGRTEDTIPSVV